MSALFRPKFYPQSMNRYEYSKNTQAIFPNIKNKFRTIYC